jgi:hypothetical protein
MKRFKCPKCGALVLAIATEVSHRCPSNKNLMTRFDLVEGKVIRGKED